MHQIPDQRRLTVRELREAIYGKKNRSLNDAYETGNTDYSCYCDESDYYDDDDADCTLLSD